jgi:ubiquinone/menaquinone biosynthesis C-methylase UbiE
LRPAPASFKEIAGQYERFRPLGANDRRRLVFMLERCPVPPATTVAEIGCGTGKLLRALAEATRASRAVGVDPEPAMLRQATGLDVAVGRAEQLPLGSGTVDIALCHLVFHLVADRRRAAEELRRVVRLGGFAAVWTLTPEHVHGFYLNRYFPSLPAVDLPRFQAPEGWAALLSQAGFEAVALENTVTRRRTTAGGLARAVRGRYISTLSLLPPAEFEAGTVELEREAAADPARPVRYPQIWCLIWAR